MRYNKIKVVKKPWGRELHFAVEDEYAGKILEVKKGHRLSLQYHRNKKETMYILEGKVKFTLGGKTRTVGIGKSITVEPHTKHRVEALKDTRIIEVSTSELDDVVRVEDDYNRN